MYSFFFYSNKIQLEYSFILLGIISLGLIKVSATFLYWQLFAQVRFRRFLIIWIVVLIGWTVTFALAHVFQCGSHLTAMFGTPEEYEMWCGAAEPAGYGYVGSDIATDLITLIIPIPVVSKSLSTYQECTLIKVKKIASLQLQMSRKAPRPRHIHDRSSFSWRKYCQSIYLYQGVTGCIQPRCNL